MYGVEVSNSGQAESLFVERQYKLSRLVSGVLNSDLLDSFSISHVVWFPHY